jgi:hypothetical protein
MRRAVGRVSLGPDAVALVREIWGLGNTCPGGRPQPVSVACGVASRTSGHELGRRLVPGTGGTPRDAWGKHITRGSAVTSPLKRHLSKNDSFSGNANQGEGSGIVDPLPRQPPTPMPSLTPPESPTPVDASQ